jgi:hypothetical protein
VTLRCWQCGSPMTTKRKKPCYVHGEPALGKPIFCSTKCAHVFKPHNPTLTLSHFLGLASQFQP